MSAALMKRPKYETSSHLSAEADAASYIATHYGLEMIKLPVQYKLDYAVVNEENDVRFFLEVKCRTYSMEELADMGGVILSVAKLDAARSLVETTGRPFCFAVGTSDGLHVCWIGRVCFPFKRIIVGGRRDRNDWQDVEPVVQIPRNMFQKIGVRHGR